MSKPIVHFVLEDMDVEVPVGSSFQEIVEACGADVTFDAVTEHAELAEFKLIKE